MCSFLTTHDKKIDTLFDSGIKSMWGFYGAGPKAGARARKLGSGKCYPFSE